MDALAALQQAARSSPQDAQARFRLAHELQRRGLLAEAIAAYRQVLELVPDLPEAHNNLGNALRDAGQLQEAIPAYRRALEIRPDFADAHNNLGVALRRLRRREEALASFGRALELRPDFADAHSNLGNALRDLGRLEEATASYRRALELRPQFAIAHSNLGNALRDLGRLEEAAASYRRALELQPAVAEVHSNLGNVFLDLLHLDEAAACYARALSIRPDYAHALTALGRVRRQQGRPAEADASCRRALEVEPLSPEALTFLGELQADQGRFADAEALFRQAIGSDPNLPAAWTGITRCRTMGAEDAAWLVAAERLLAEQLPVRHEINLRYALGKYFNDLGDYEHAFDHYRRANELTRRLGARYDREKLSSKINWLTVAYDCDRLLGVRLQGLASERPVFVVGMPRSGTTLAEQILASHPAVFGAGELPFWNDAAETYDPAAPDGEAVAGAVTALAGRYLQQLAALSADALRVVDKMPTNYMHLGLIHAAFPAARIIHMRRDPFDTCLSIYFQNFAITHSYAIDLEDLAHFYNEYARLMRHWRSVLPQGVMLEVAYEGLLEEPERWSRRMLEFVGLPWEPRCLEFHETRRSVITPSRWQVRQRIDRSRIGRWRHYERFIGPLRQLLQSE